MRRLLALVLCIMMLPAAFAQAETLTGKANGFIGPVTVTVTVEGDKITGVTVDSHNETNGIGTMAVEQIPAAIVAANSADVDVVANATMTSKAIIAAVIFDAEGKVAASYVDQLEIATPNYDGSTMPHLSGFPGHKYNNDENHDAVVDGVIEVAEETFLAEVETWQSKRERGEGYVMGTGVWAQQMDKFEQLFVGKTIEEVKAWFAAYCSDRNGRPLKAGSSNEQDAAKYDALTEDEKAMLADVTSSATMSLNDGHGNILGALEKAGANRVAIELTIGK